MHHELKKFICTMLGVASLLLMVWGTADSSPPMRAWAIFLAMPACVMTVWILLQRERIRIEQLAKIVSAAQTEMRQHSSSDGDGQVRPIR